MLQDLDVRYPLDDAAQGFGRHEDAGVLWVVLQRDRYRWTDALGPKGLNKIHRAKVDKLPLVRGNPRLGPCVGAVGNFIGIGLNYADHAAEAGSPVPREPVVFNKALSSICGPNDDTMIPKGSTKLDYEVELGIVIGQTARYLAKKEAMAAVAGYCVCNDVSERAFQREHG